MLGLMQERPLLISSIIDHAEKYHGDREVISIMDDGVHRSSWADIAVRVRQLANALSDLGVGEGTIVATLANNSYRHLELYYAVSSIGAVLHTINPRFSEEQTEYIVNHAEDAIFVFDSVYLQSVQALAPKCNTIQCFIELSEEKSHNNINGRTLHSYEALLSAADKEIEWPSLNENSASVLCYTSGTSGKPKGVLYSHRSTILHAYALCMPDSYCISASTNFLLVVPLCHGTAWGVPYAAAMTGAKLVLHGAQLDGETIYHWMAQERITHSGAVPTVLVSLLDYIKVAQRDPKNEICLERFICGGSAVPKSMFEDFDNLFGPVLQQGWGMTELNPCGVHGVPLAKHRDTELMDARLKQGRPAFGVDIKITSPEGEVLPFDGETRGSLCVRGPWVIDQYFKDEGNLLDKEGYFNTGDIVEINKDGYVRIVDRAKDIIKSGGEWISSTDLENAAMSHPCIRQVAVIGVYHPKWQERPLMICVATEGSEVTREEVLDYLKGCLPRWWVPDDVIFIENMPLNPNGKLAKLSLRKEFGDYELPTAGN